MNSYVIMAVATITLVATIGIPMTTAAFAQEDPARGGLDQADRNVHDRTGLGGDVDTRFHEGLCQGGHSTTAVDTLLGGCSFFGPPGGK
jgi:hypothetical protein